MVFIFLENRLNCNKIGHGYPYSIENLNNGADVYNFSPRSAAAAAPTTLELTLACTVISGDWWRAAQVHRFHPTNPVPL